MNSLKVATVGLTLIATVQTTHAQSLQISRQGDTINICWPATPGCQVLQSSASLGSDADWEADLAAPSGGGGGNQCVSVTAVDHTRFYRVARPISPPAAPANARYRADAELLSLAWDRTPDATSYNFYVGLTPQVGPAANVKRLLGLTDAVATVDALTPGQRYYLAVTAVNCLGEGAPSAVVEAVFGPRGEVTGALVTREVDGPGPLISPAGVDVFLENVEDASQTSHVPTDGFGGFKFGGVPVGRWKPCWDASGYVPGCGEEFDLTSDGVALGEQEIVPLSGGSGRVFGRVTFADGSVPHGGDSFFDIWVSVAVSLVEPGGNVLASAPINADGEFLLAGVPRAPGLTLRAQLESAQVEQVIDTTVVGRADLVIPNRPPVITGLKALVNGTLVLHADEGDPLELVGEATDPDGDSLQYRWLDGDAETGPVIGDGPAHANWTVPRAAAKHIAYLRVTDGKGGVATARLVLDGTGQTLFTGVVVGGDGPVLPGATVLVNGKFEATTDGDGWFSLLVDQRQGPFALAISRPGYASYFSREATGETGGTYVLSKLAEPDCNLSPASEIHVAGSAGSSLTLPPLALRTEDGLPITSPVCVSVTPLDPCALERDPFFPTRLGESPSFPMYFFGMVFAEARPDSGPAPGVALGSRATVVIPLREECLAAAGLASPPDKLRLWRLYIPGATWEHVDDAQRVELAGGQIAYVGTVPVLGLLAIGGNSDQKEVPLEITLDKTLNAALEIRVLQGKTLLLRHVFDNDTANNTGEDAIKLTYKAPPAKDLKIQVIHLKEAPGRYYGDVNNDAADFRKEEDKTVILERPVDASKLDPAQTNPVVLSLDQNIKGLALNRITNVDHFLTFESRQAQTLGLKINAFEESDGYYQAVEGAVGLQPNFDTWLKRNGFFDNGKFIADARAIYFNACDLGLGRAMFVKSNRVEVKVSVAGPDDKPKVETRTHTNIAYFVTNFDTVEHAATANVPANVRADPGTIATVAMEYSYGPFNDKGVALLPRPYTKFYVFNDVGNRANFADLDRFGNKAIPNLCINCHGGRPVAPISRKAGVIKLGFLDQFERPDTKKPAVYPDKGEAFLGDVEANFIPFDATSFTYSAKGVPLAEFRKLNDLILATKPTAAVAAAIAGWRGPVTQFALDYTPADWNAQKSLYLDVFGISCRSCHITRKPALQFPSFAAFSKRATTIAGTVCSRQVMPNAQRTYGVFWGSLSAQKYPNKFQVKNQPDLLSKALKDGDFSDCPTLRP